MRFIELVIISVMIGWELPWKKSFKKRVFAFSTSGEIHTDTQNNVTKRSIQKKKMCLKRDRKTVIPPKNLAGVLQFY